MIINFLNYRTEKNACAWSQEKIKDLFTNLNIDGNGGNVRI